MEGTCPTTVSSPGWCKRLYTRGGRPDEPLGRRNRAGCGAIGTPAYPAPSMLVGVRSSLEAEPMGHRGGPRPGAAAAGMCLGSRRHWTMRTSMHPGGWGRLAARPVPPSSSEIDAGPCVDRSDTGPSVSVRSDEARTFQLVGQQVGPEAGPDVLQVHRSTMAGPKSGVPVDWYVAAVEKNTTS